MILLNFSKEKIKMGGGQSNVAKSTQEFMNNITQVDQQNCLSSVIQDTSGNVVIISGDKIKGSVTGVTNTLSTDSSCLMSSNISASVSNILKSIMQQTNSTKSGLFGDLLDGKNNNDIDIFQSVVNNISNVNQSTCSASTMSSSNNNYVYLSNSVVGGNFVGVNESSNTSADCSMSNTMKTSVFNSGQASGSQKNKTMGIFGIIMGIVGLIVVMGIVMVILVFVLGAFGVIGVGAKSLGGSGKSGKTPEAPTIIEGAPSGSSSSDVTDLLLTQSLLGSKGAAATETAAAGTAAKTSTSALTALEEGAETLAV